MGKFSLSLLSLFYFFFPSLAIPRFGFLSHVSSLRLPLGHSGLVLTLSNAAHTSLFSPDLLVADTSIWVTSLLGAVVRPVICGVCLFIYFPPGYVALWDSKTSHRPASERVSWCLETSLFKTPFLGRVFVPNSFVPLFIFYILSYLLSKTMGCLSGCLVSSTSIQLFVVFAQCSNDLLMNLWGRKWSPHLIPLPS